MREIIFRGKPTGSVMNEEDVQDFMFDLADGFVHGNLITDEHEPTIVGKVVDSDWDYCSMEWWCPVIKETVGQFTGLLDKNGKKIFEGDIFVSDYFEDGTKFVVIFEHGAFCGKSERTGIFPLGFANDSDETGCEDDDFYYPDDYSIHIKVVGNIHDNLDLIKA